MITRTQNIQTPGTASIQANKELTVKDATAHREPQPTEPISSMPFIDPVPAMMVFRRVTVANTNERLANQPAELANRKSYAA
ncbi:hypothetical protein TMatcc_004212 [Talaromyces marneffei ATCC 18224]